MSQRTVVIMGAAGRDFHNFNIVFRDDPGVARGGLHRHADPRHRGPPLSARARRAPGTRDGIPIVPEAEPGGLLPPPEGD